MTMNSRAEECRANAPFLPGALCIALALTGLTHLACFGADDDAYLCKRATTPVKIDGKLDEPAWQGAEKIQDLMVPPVMDWTTLAMTQPKPAKSRTVARLLWDDEFLYLGMQMQDLDVYGVHEGHDAAFGGEDLAELFIKPSRERPEYWEFHVNPLGGTRDYFYARRGAGTDARWKPYETGMKAAVRIRGTLNHWEDRDHGWTIEMAIPLAAFENVAPRPKPGDRWSFMVSRYDYSVHLEEGRELSASAPLPKQSFHLHEYYPEFVFGK